MIEVLGTSAVHVTAFVGFGFLIGILFGFFGMGGSFLVTPALLVMDYPTKVAVGSGLAFVFGTSVIATLKHRDLGQVDVKLGVGMVAGTTAGIEAGKELVLLLEKVGLAGSVVSVAYVVLLGGVGVFVTREAIGAGTRRYDEDTESEAADVPAVARRIQSIRVPPMLELRGGVHVSLWTILGVGLVTGFLAGLLGVGGGFIRMPALFYLIGVPVPVAVGTDLFEIVVSGGVGSFLYALEGGVDLGIVTPLLVGSALGARLGSRATTLVDEAEIKVYFGVMLLGGAIAVTLREIGLAYDVPVLGPVSLALLVGSALLVSGALVYSSVVAVREGQATGPPAD